MIEQSQHSQGLEMEPGKRGQIVIEVEISEGQKTAKKIFALTDISIETGLKLAFIGITIPSGPIGYFLTSVLTNWVAEHIIDPVEEVPLRKLGLLFPGALHNINRSYAYNLGQFQRHRKRPSEHVQESPITQLPNNEDNVIHEILPLSNEEKDKVLTNLSSKLADSWVFMKIVNKLIPFTLTSDALHAYVDANTGRMRLSIDAQVKHKGVVDLGRKVSVFLLTGEDPVKVSEQEKNLEESLNFFAGALTLLLLRYPSITGLRLISIPREYEDSKIVREENLYRQYNEYRYQAVLNKILGEINLNREQLLKAVGRQGKR